MSKWMSRKLLVTVGSVVTIVLTNTLGIPEDQAARITDALTIVVGLFLGGQGIVDAAGALKK